MAEHGEIRWSKLRWSQHPQIALRHQDFDDVRVRLMEVSALCARLN